MFPQIWDACIRPSVREHDPALTAGDSFDRQIIFNRTSLYMFLTIEYVIYLFICLQEADCVKKFYVAKCPVPYLNYHSLTNVHASNPDDGSLFEEVSFIDNNDDIDFSNMFYSNRAMLALLPETDFHQLATAVY